MIDAVQIVSPCYAYAPQQIVFTIRDRQPVQASVSLLQGKDTLDCPNTAVQLTAQFSGGKVLSGAWETEAYKPHAGIRSRQTAPTSSTRMNARRIVWWTASVCMFARFRHLSCRQIQVGPVREILFPCPFLTQEDLLLMFSRGGMGILIRIADFQVIQVFGLHFNSWMHAANSHAIQRSSTFLIKSWPLSLQWKTPLCP